jgi:hypothetical protein
VGPLYDMYGHIRTCMWVICVKWSTGGVGYVSWSNIVQKGKACGVDGMHNVAYVKP